MTTPDLAELKQMFRRAPFIAEIGMELAEAGAAAYVRGIGGVVHARRGGSSGGEGQRDDERPRRCVNRRSAGMMDEVRNLLAAADDRGDG